MMDKILNNCNIAPVNNSTSCLGKELTMLKFVTFVLLFFICNRQVTKIDFISGQL